MSPVRLGPKISGLLAAATTVILMAFSADDPGDRLRDPAAEAHARALFRDIRCLVCQNQSIDESEAPLAEDLRKIVRAQVAAGRTDAQIKAYIVARYGEFALERPTVSLGNAVLWGAPFLVLVAGGGVLFLHRGRAAAAEPPLTPEEEARLERISVPPT